METLTATLRSLKQMKMKPNHSALSKEYGRDRHTIKKMFERLIEPPNGARWNGRYNDAPRMVLKLKPPNPVELEKLERMIQDAGEVRCLRLFKCFTLFDN